MRRKTTVKRKPATKRKAAPRKRRRVSGIGSINLQSVAMDVLALAGGAIAARELSTIALKQFPGTSHMLIGAGQIAVGVILPRMWKAKIADDIGKGMIAFGGQVLAVEAGLIAGIGNINQGSDTMSYRISGGAQLRSVNGPARLQALNGAGNLSTVGGAGDLMPKAVTRRTLGNTY